MDQRVFAAWDRMVQGVKYGGMLSVWTVALLLALPAWSQVNEGQSTTANKAVISWNNPAGGSWHNAANWSTGMVPSSVDQVIIDGLGSSASYTITISAGAQADTVTLGDGLGGTQELLVTGNLVALDAFNGMTINNGGLLSIENQGDVQSQNGATLLNQGIIVLADAKAQIDILNTNQIFAKGFSQLEGIVTNSGTIIVEGTATFGNAQLTMAEAGGFSNDGTVNLTSLGAVATAMLDLPFGMTNGSTGSINAQIGAGGQRFINGALNNDGLIDVFAPLGFVGGSVNIVNSGFISVIDSVLEVNLTPGFTFTNIIDIDLRGTGTFRMNNGFFNQAGSITNTVLGAPKMILENVTLQTNGLTNNYELDMIGCTVPVGTGLTNNGTLNAIGLNTIQETFTNTGTLNIAGQAGPVSAEWLVQVPFTNGGNINLTSADASANAALRVTSPPFTNNGTVTSDFGMGGTRFLGVALVNNGDMVFNHVTNMGFPSATNHLNANGARIELNADLTLDLQGVGTSSFTNTGGLQIGLGQTFTLLGGEFDPSTGVVDTVVPKRAVGSFLRMDGVTIINNTFSNLVTTTLSDCTVNMNGGLDNQAEMIFHGTISVQGSFTTASGSVLRVEGLNPFGAALVNFSNGFTNNGELRLDAPANNNNVTLDVAVGTLTNSSTGLILVLPGGGGTRAIQAELDNQGALDAQAPLNITKTGGNHSNSGLFTASGGNITLALDVTGSFVNTNQIQIETGIQVAVTNGDFNNTGSLSSPMGNGIFTLDNCTFTGGSLVIPLGIECNIINTSSNLGANISNNGQVVVKGVCNLSGLFENPSGTLFVAGDGAFGNADMNLANGFTNGGDIVLTATDPGQTCRMAWTAGTLVNTGNITSTPGSGGGQRELFGSLIHQGPGTVTINHPTLFSGQDAVHTSQGIINVIGGDLTLDDVGMGGQFNNEGPFVISAGRTVTLNNMNLDNRTGLPFGAIEGDGNLNVTSGTFNNESLISPGLMAGSLQVTGNVASTATAEIAIEVGGINPVTDFDVLNVSGNLDFDGLLNIQLINGFTPVAGDTFQILNFGSSTGTFAAFNGLGVVGSVYLDLDINPTNVVLRALPLQSFWANAAGGNWTNPANWNPAALPGSETEVFVDLDGTYTVTLTSDVEVARFNLGANAGTQRLFVDGVTIHTVDGLNVIGANGILDLNDATITVAPPPGPVTPPTIQNGGSIEAEAICNIDMPLDNGPSGVVQIAGAAGPTDANLALIEGMTNAGDVILTSSDPGAAAILDVLSGVIDNFGRILMLTGSGGGRTINSDVFNQLGAEFRADLPATVSGGSALIILPKVDPATGSIASVREALRAEQAKKANHQSRTKMATGFLDNAGTVEIRNGANMDLLNIDLLNQTSGLVSGDGNLSLPVGFWTQDGTVAPGLVGAGLLSTDAALTMGTTSVFNVDIAGLGAGTGFDQLNTTDVLTLDGDLNVGLLGGYVPNIGDSFPIANANSVVGAPANVNLPFIAADREFSLNVGASTVALDVIPAMGVVAPGELTFSFGSIVVNEDDGLIPLTVERLNGTDGGITVEVQTIAGTAAGSQDYLPINGVLSFANGETGPKQVFLEIVDNNVDEGTESLTVQLSNPTGGATLGSLPSINVTIQDNDDARVAWEFPSVNRREGDSDLRAEESFIIRGRLTQPASRTLILPVNLGGTATEGEDYEALSDRLEFPPGEIFVDFELLLLGDDVHEGDETIELEIGVGNVPSIEPSVFVLNIFDNEATPTVNWFGIPPTIYEGFGAKVDAPVTLTAKLSHPSQIEMTAPFSVGGTTTFGQDHDLEDGNLVFPPGEDTQTITFTLLDDNAPEPPESLVVQIGSGGTAIPGSIRNKTIRVEDNDTPRVSWALAEQTIVEDDAGAKSQLVTLTARLSAALPIPESVPFAVGGSASFGEDHDLNPGTLQFEAGQTEVQLSFNVLGDVEQEATEVIVVSLVEDDLLLGDRFKHVVRIVDNDPNQAPDTAIISPADLSVWRVDEVIPFAAEGSDPQNDPLTFHWELCKSAGGCQTAEGQTLSGMSFAEPGIYVITCWARDSAGNVDPIPDQIRVRVVPRKPPTIRIVSPAERPLRVVAGTEVTFQAEVDAPDSESFNVSWYLLATPDDETDGSRAAFNFAEPGVYRVVAKVTDNFGDEAMAGVTVRVGDQVTPPGLRIISPASEASFALGEPVDWLGELLAPPVQSKTLEVFWDLGDGRQLIGLDPEPLSYSEPGRYLVKLFARDSETGLFLQDQRVIFVRGQDQPPIVDINLPTDLLVQPPATSKRADAGEVFFSALTFDPQGYRRLVYFWDFGNGITRREAVPGRIRYENPGVYTVTLYAMTPAGVQSEVLTRNVVVQSTSDRQFEPNEVMEQAPLLVPGTYENLRLDDLSSTDLYRIAVPRDGQRLNLRLDSNDVVLLQIMDAGGRLVREESSHGLNSVQIQGLNAGEYFVKIVPASTAKRATISYSFDVLVQSPALFYPQMEESAVASTAMGVVNTTESNACLEAIGYDGTGEIVASVSLELPPKGRADQNMHDLFGGFADQVAWVQINSDRNLTGYSRTASGDEQELYALTASKVLNGELFVPHIAEQTAQWFTRAAVINGTDQSLTSSVVTPGSVENLNLAEGFAVDAFDFQSRFGGAIAIDDVWARFVEENNETALAGAEIFGTKDGSRIVAGLELANVRADNPNFTFVANNLYFTHVARDVANFYTGIALVNIGDTSQSYTVRGYGDGGLEVGTKTVTMGPNEKLVAVAETFLAGLGSPADVDWFVVEADSDIVGFELFGTRNGKQLAGLEATTALQPNLCYPFLAEDPAIVHGISVVNVNADATAVTFTLHGDDGNVLAQIDHTLAGFEKFSATIRDIFADTPLPAGTSGWLSVNAELPLAGFELFVNTVNGEQMGAVIAQ